MIGPKQIIDKKIVESMYKDGFRHSAFGEYWRRKHGYKVFKIPLNAEMTCPNWDGRLSDKGCAFCPTFARQFTYDSFRHVMEKGVKEQVAHQVEHYKNMGAGDKAQVYIAFATNTYRRIDDLRKLFDEVLDHPDVVGMSVGTRPDCVPDEVVKLLGEYRASGHDVWVELGQQTTHYHTLEAINRQHGLAESIRVTDELHDVDIPVIFFIILGLPYETPAEMMETARVMSAIGVDAIKLYPLIVMKETKMAADYQQGRYRPLGFTEYVSLVGDFLENLSPYVLVQRMSKDCGLETKLAPDWNSYRLVVGPRVEKEMIQRNAVQGDKYKITLEENELGPYSPEKSKGRGYKVLPRDAPECKEADE
jgi:uncharacterized protein